MSLYEGGKNYFYGLGKDCLVIVCSLRMKCCADNWAARQEFIHACYVVKHGTYH